MNKVILVGRLTADPEFRQTQSGIPCCRFRIAVDRPKTKDGNQETDFIGCVAWRSTAEFVSRYFSKGKRIILEGQLRNNDYTDNNGVKHYSNEVLIDNAEFGEPKQSGQQEQPPQHYGAAPQQYHQPPQQYGAPPQQYQQPYQQPPQFGAVPPPANNPYHQ